MNKAEERVHKIAQLLCDGIKISLETQLSSRGKSIKKVMDWRTYAKEYCTVRFQTSRLSGHTGAIRAILESQLFALPVVLVDKVAQAKVALKSKQYPNVKIEAISALPRLVERLRGTTIPVVFIDGASQLGPVEVESVYKHFEPWGVGQKTMLFVFVG
jgi:hypothetical protein